MKKTVCFINDDFLHIFLAAHVRLGGKSFSLRLRQEIVTLHLSKI